MCVGNFEVLRLYSREWLWSFTEPRPNSPLSPRYLMTMGNRKAKKFYYYYYYYYLKPRPAPSLFWHWMKPWCRSYWTLIQSPSTNAIQQCALPSLLMQTQIRCIKFTVWHTDDVCTNFSRLACNKELRMAPGIIFLQSSAQFRRLGTVTVSDMKQAIIG